MAALAGLALLLPGVDSFALNSMEQRPTWPQEVNFEERGLHAEMKGLPPVDTRANRLLETGDDPREDSSIKVSRFLHLGCFKAPLSMNQQFVSSGFNYDPNECLKTCLELYPNASTYTVIFAVHQDRCLCHRNDMTAFTEADDRMCTYNCKFYRNPICGGPPDYWGLFREYDMQSMSTQGAFDPWRYVWYTVVIVKERTVTGGFSVPEDTMPERYYLHAANTNTGEAQFQFMMRLPGIIYGMQYDIDSTRLVGLFTAMTTGRLRIDVPWQYKLCTILCNTTFKDRPYMQFAIAPLFIRSLASENYMGFNGGASTILSLPGRNVYIFTQVQGDVDLKKDWKDRLYVVSIGSGQIIFEEKLDFKVLVLFGNEKYGDLSALGPRPDYVSGGGGQQTMVYLARVFYSTITEQTEVHWMFNMNQPTFLQDEAAIGNMQVYPGVASSEHLRNLSVFAYRAYPASADLGAGAITIRQVNIRNANGKSWCNESDCGGTIWREIPYASIYNKEPRIPLSLPAPQLVSAVFTMEAMTIIVDFDKPTLRGAMPIDENNDYVPDYVNRTMAPQGLWDCGIVFDAKSVELLGEFNPEDPADSDSASCSWVTDSRIRISLPTVLNITFGDSIFVNPDTIYTEPENDQWSSAASGGIQVGKPDPLEYPVIILTGVFTIDECSGVTISAANSFNRGKWKEFDWALVPATEEQPNPVDLRNDPERVFDEAKFEALKDELRIASENDNNTLVMESEAFEAAATYTLVLNVTSRWELTTNRTFTISKLNFATPSVALQGGDEVFKKRTEEVSLTADGQPSSCANANTVLLYEWVCVSGNFDFDEYPEIKTNVRALIIPPFHLEPLPDEEYHMYNFTVLCYVDGPGGDDPARTATASVTVFISKSDVVAQTNAGSRLATRREVLVLDARSSFDPDYPTMSGQTFKGTFEWKCLSPSREPCFGNSATGMLQDIQTCRQNVGEKIVDHGVQYYAPLFDDLDYCGYARGILMVQTDDMPLGEYKFTIVAIAYDGREADLDIYITLTETDVPRIVLSILDPRVKYPVTSQIKIRGQIEGSSSSDTERTYSWEVSSLELNGEYDPYAAEEQSPDNPYNVDKYVFKPDETLDVSDPEKFTSFENIPNFVIHAGALTPAKTYQFKLIIDVGAPENGYSSITLTTAGLAPKSGTLFCNPQNASMDTPRVLEAPGWGAEDKPLTYMFGYYAAAGLEFESRVQIFLTPAPSQILRLEVPNLPMGVPPPGANYTLVIFVEVATPFGAKTTAEFIVQSLPPDNTTQAVADGIQDALDADGASVLQDLNYLLSLDPTNPELQQLILDIMDQKGEDVPVSVIQQKTKGNILTSMLDSGNIGDDIMDQVEDLVIETADSNSLDPGDSLAGMLVNLIGGLMPTAENDPYAASGQSTVMSKHRIVNQDFAFGHRQAKQEHFAFGATREWVNHPEPEPGNFLVKECLTAFCDWPFLICVPDSKSIYICCDTINPSTLCNEPPCWQGGVKCSYPSTPPSGRIAGPKAERRLRDRSLESQPERRSGSAKSQTFAPKSSWFDAWSDHNFPLQSVNERHLSDWDRAAAFHGWHPDIYERRLQFATINRSQSEAERILALELDEKPLLERVRRGVKEKLVTEETQIKNEARDLLSFQTMSPAVAQMLSERAAKEKADRNAWRFEYERNTSQRITRLVVMRDVVAKQLIKQIQTGDRPLQLPSRTFTLYVGKATNMSMVLPSFKFPKQFEVPADSPDEPTVLTNVTAFAFEYVEYSSNIYSWSTNNPSNESMLITLIVMKASTDDLDERTVEDPITVYADIPLYSNVVCLYWDRFAPNTPGGAWSSQGILNNEQGCITSHLSDVGIFIDGSVPTGTDFIDVAAFFDREVFEETCIGCDGERNYVVVAVLGMVLFTNMLLIMLGFVVDETWRKGGAPKYHLGGDGIEGPATVDDAIAYSLVSDNPVQMWIGTLLNVTMREHAVLSVFVFHETFTRPQRLQCFTALLVGLLAVNAAVHSSPGYAQEAREWFISGILSGLLVYPVFVGLVVMFNMRPRSVKKRLIKRATSTKKADMNQMQRDLLAQISMKMPGKAKSTSGVPWHPGNTTLLGMPAPLPLPPLPPGKAGGTLGITGNLSLPSLPPGIAPLGGLAGMGGTLALPGMTANMPMPPPPRYPPPPKGATISRPILDMRPPLPNEFPKVGPPPAPFQQLPPIAAIDPALNNKAFDGSNTRLPVADTGATPQGNAAVIRPLEDSRVDNADASTGALGAREGNDGAAGGASPRRGNDLELPALPPASTASEARHTMAPGTPPGSAPTPNGSTFPPRPAGIRTPPGSGRRASPSFATAAGVSPRSPSGARSPSAASVDRGAGVGGMLSPATNASIRLPPAPSQLVAQAQGPLPLFIRAEPPSNLPSPYAPMPAGPSGMSTWKVQGAPPNGMAPPVPSQRIPGTSTVPMAPLVPPPPPPPPREEDQAFVRRIQYTYFDKVAREHEKFDLLEDFEELGAQTPGWVYDTMTLMPYLACSTFTLMAIFIVLQYGVKFVRWQEEHWIKGSLLGLMLVLTLLEVCRICMMTLVELRKFETRKKAKAGSFMPKRVPDMFQPDQQLAPPPRLWKNATAIPSVPKDPNIRKLPKNIPAIGPGQPAIVHAAPKPLAFSNAAMSMGSDQGHPNLPALNMGPVNDQAGTPNRSLQGSHRSNGSRQVTPKGGGNPPVGGPLSGAATPAGVADPRPPRAPQAGELQHGAAPPGSLSPHSTHSQSLHSLNQSMNLQVKAGASRHPTPPPPPGQGARSLSRGSGLPPPPPAEPRPPYSRTPSRPSSAASGGPGARRAVPPLAKSGKVAPAPP